MKRMVEIEMSTICCCYYYQIIEGILEIMKLLKEMKESENKK